jgi:hypothetical protein
MNTSFNIRALGAAVLGSADDTAVLRKAVAGTRSSSFDDATQARASFRPPDHSAKA